MKNQKLIELFNSLIVINNDRIEGYKTAEFEAQETDLKMLFTNTMGTSLTCRKELSDEVRKLGGVPETGTLTSGKIFRFWMDLKAELTNNDRETILDSCEYGEETIQVTYQNAMRESLYDLNYSQNQMLNKHLDWLQTDFKKITHLLEKIVAQQKAEEVE